MRGTVMQHKGPRLSAPRQSRQRAAAVPRCSPGGASQGVGTWGGGRSACLGPGTGTGADQGNQNTSTNSSWGAAADATSCPTYRSL